MFWINLLVRRMLACMALAGAAVIADFHHEPRLRWMTIAMVGVLVFNALEYSIRRCCSARCASPRSPWEGCLSVSPFYSSHLSVRSSTYWGRSHYLFRGVTAQLTGGNVT